MASKTQQLKNQGFNLVSPKSDHIEVSGKTSPKYKDFTPVIFKTDKSFVAIGMKMKADGTLFRCNKNGLNQRWPEII